MNQPLQSSTIDHCEKPLDLLAARQLFPAHWHHTDNTTIAPSCYWSADPIETQDCPQFLKRFIGRKRGRCEVVGFFGRIENREYMVTRCLCGGFELIRTKTLMKKERGEHMCARCRTLDHHRFLRENPEQQQGRRGPKLKIL